MRAVPGGRVGFGAGEPRPQHRDEQQIEQPVDLETPIREIVDLSGTTISPEVTVRQLLTHTSGIADDADEEAGESYQSDRK